MNIFKSLFGKNTRPAEVKQDPIQEKAYCPYCKAELKSFPTQKKKCPQCGNMIYVKSRYGASTKVLATEAEKDEIDADKQLHYFENRHLRNLENESFLDKSRYIAQRDEWLKGHTYKQIKDFMWNYYNELLLQNAKNPNNLKSLYFLMGLFLIDEGKESFEMFRQSYNIELKQYKKDRYVSHIEICGDEDSCEQCKALQGKKYTIDEALKLQLLPVRNCSNEQLKYRCLFYGAEVDR